LNRDVIRASRSLTLNGDLQHERLRVCLDEEAVNIFDRERQKRLDALDLANCPDSLQDPADFFQGQTEEDTVVTESPAPSIDSDRENDSVEVIASSSIYSDGQVDGVGVIAGPSKGNGVACAMSMPMPMGPYQPSKHATPVVNPGTHHDSDDDGWCTSRMGSLLGCWNRSWWVWGCSWFMCGRPLAG